MKERGKESDGWRKRKRVRKQRECLDQKGRGNWVEEGRRNGEEVKQGRKKGKIKIKRRENRTHEGTEVKRNIKNKRN